MRRRSQVRNVVEYCAALVALTTLQWTPRKVGLRPGPLLHPSAGPRDSAPAARGPAEPGDGLAGVHAPTARRNRRWCVSLHFPHPGHLRQVPGHSPRLPGATGFAWREESTSTWRAQAGRGVLVATAHLGNWELSAFAHALMTSPMNVVVRPLDNPLIDRLVERRRALTGNRPIGKKDFARSILKALAANQAVGILIDQNAGLEDGTFVDFFGLPASRRHRFCQVRGPQRRYRNPRLRPVEPGGAALRPPFLSAPVHDRRCGARHPNPAIRPGASHSRVSRPVALDSSPVEDPTARLAFALRFKAATPIRPPTVRAYAFTPLLC